ncbi:MAG: SDR family oxidoreductase [Streptomycetaceae bacterium]|nr:MAG: SDR family oxidoreductase [Streptomycetaceae bacterium]
MSRNVLVTGGTGGIGRAFVDRFVQNGDKVWLTYLRESENPQKIVDAYEADAVQAFQLDLGSHESVAQIANDLPGIPDVLIHNAGLGSKTVEYLTDVAYEQPQMLIQVNAIGTLWLNDPLMPKMVARGSGSILLISSVCGGVTQFAGFNYADGMSKAAIAFLGRTLAADLTHTGVEVFTICPGATNTPMFAASTLNNLNEADKRDLISSLPKSRLIEPKEIAELGLFLASDAGKILHGAVIDASMGLGVNPGLLKK